MDLIVTILSLIFIIVIGAVAVMLFLGFFYFIGSLIGIICVTIFRAARRHIKPLDALVRFIQKYS